MLKYFQKESELLMKDNKLKHEEINIHKSIQRLIEDEKYIQAEKYLRKYYYSLENDRKNEYLALSFVKTLRINRKYEEAIDVALSMIYTKNRNYFLYELLLIYISLNQLEEAYKYYCLIKKEDENVQKKINKDFDIVEYFLFTKLYELDPVKYKKYKDIKVKRNNSNIDAVSKHVINEHSFEKHPQGKSYFNADVNIYELLEQIKTKISSNNNNIIYITEDISKKYFFRIKEFIGFSKTGNACNTIEVITTWDNEILTVYPVYNIDNSMINSFYEIEEETTFTKVKRKSQIEKFNQKYNL